MDFFVTVLEPYPPVVPTPTLRYPPSPFLFSGVLIHTRKPEADGGKAGGYSSGLPPLEPPHLQGQPPQEYGYGTFQGHRHPPVGFPQPAPPPGFSGSGGYHNQQQPYAPAEPYYAQGYQAVPGMVRVFSVAETVCLCCLA